MRLITLTISLLALLGGCASREPLNPAFFEIERGKLPHADITLNIPGLGPCTDNPDRNLHLDSSQPVNILVHGCFGSSGQFRGLAQVLAFQGQQSACFTYDDRASLTGSATELRRAVNQLAIQTHTPKITVIGHSQGALISHKSLTELPIVTPQEFNTDLRLVTISGPFDGIASAQTCGKTWLYPLTLGLLPISCHIITGEKWSDITNTSSFIREPGSLDSKVSNYLKIDTDERNSCRRTEGTRCVEDDFVFSAEEQRNALVENDSRSKRVVVRAGHVEIVGDKRVAPLMLIAILQEQGVLRTTKPEQVSEFKHFLAHIYHDNSLLINTVLNNPRQP